VTVSLGAAATMPSTDRSLERLIAAADHALYRSKAAGRNCTTAVAVGGGPPEKGGARCG
jgi:PleD family two-component response regulator